MKSLEKYLLPVQLITDVNEDITDEFAIVTNDSLHPLQCLTLGKETKDFLVVQVSNPYSLSPNDDLVIQQVIFDLFRSIDAPDSPPVIVIVNSQSKIQGIIRPQDIEDISLLPSESLSTEKDQFGGTVTIPGGIPDLPVIAWVCPKHPDVKPYYAHQSGAEIPQCPICNELRVPQRQNITVASVLDSSNRTKEKPHLLSRLASLLLKRK